MTEPYKALRVPIPLLHQKVYPTSHRLSKWEGFVLKVKDGIVDFSSTVKVDAARVISPSAVSTSVTPQYKRVENMNLFEITPYLRRFFLLEDEKERVRCRYCNEIAETLLERTDHVPCYKGTSAILARLLMIGK